MSGHPAWLYAYYSTIPLEETIRAHERHDLEINATRQTNFLGVLIDPSFVPHVLAGRQGSIEETPIPGNWHADMAEWAGALRAVDLAERTFRVVELGCGWGCWILNTGAAARHRGLQCSLIGVEADAGHAAFARQGLAENGFSAGEGKIIRGIVGSRRGVALFPRQEQAGESWGLEPVLDASPEQVETADINGFDVLPTYTLSDLSNEPIDLLHIDIQGGEADFIDACASDMDRLVRCVVVGTHSRLIEGRIFDALSTRGWQLEIERPLVYRQVDGHPTLSVDGVQLWRNLRMFERS